MAPLASLALVLVTLHPALPSAPQQQPSERHVILVTLDGARWQDLRGARGALYPDEHPLMPSLWHHVLTDGVWLDATTSPVIPRSLPGYLALMTGRATECDANDCARVAEETLPERIARELALPPAKVAVFTSWSRVARAASARDGAVVVDAPPDGPPASAPWPNARLDEETIERAMAHLERERPVFMHIALLDMDEHAHDRDARATADSLKRADRALKRVFAWVRSLPAAEQQQTTVIVTADHGRGRGPLWVEHGAAVPNSDEIFLVAVPRRSAGAPARKATHLDVRPTIEALLGLCPLEGPGRGRVLDEISAHAKCSGAGVPPARPRSPR